MVNKDDKCEKTNKIAYFCQLSKLKQRLSVWQVCTSVRWCTEFCTSYSRNVPVENAS